MIGKRFQDYVRHDRSFRFQRCFRDDRTRECLGRTHQAASFLTTFYVLL